jgi:D-amino-acid dehydrogenase
MATGAAMHVFTRPSVVWDILKDTAHEEFRRVFPKRADDAFRAPPYFALHLWRCVGPSADAAERSSFVRFLFHFLYTTLVQGNRAEDRGKVLMQLAKANRVAYLQEETPAPGHAQGFWSLHRSRKSAEGAMKEAREAGESSRFVEWEEAVQKEPRLARLPGQELGHQLYVVERVNDHVGNCGGFIRQKIQELKDKRVQYKPESVAKEVSASGAKQNRKYKVKTRDGAEYEFDVLVLAAGVQTPLMAAQLGVSRFCPSYPLRGYSLTIHIPPEKGKGETKSRNLLFHPFSVDAMYCSSVSTTMARWAGFGEFVGYKDKAKDFYSIAPEVLVRYASQVFPEAGEIPLTQAQACFRPLSPDDIPIAGEVPSMPGVFLHTGHGTLGWTLCLATGDCVAQAIMNHLSGDSSQGGNYELADNSILDRKLISPSRFEWGVS